MELSGFGIFVLALTIAILGFVGIRALLKYFGFYPQGLGYIACLILTMAVWFILLSITPKITVITGVGGDLEHKEIRALFSYNGNKISFGKDYVDNQTENTLIIYPEVYSEHLGDASRANVRDDDVTTIDPYSLIAVKHFPDYYFYAPSAVYTKSRNKTEVKWILKSLSKVMEEIELEEKINSRYGGGY